MYLDQSIIALSAMEDQRVALCGCVCVDYCSSPLAVKQWCKSQNSIDE